MIPVHIQKVWTSFMRCGCGCLKSTDKKVKINLESSGICLPFVVENLKSTYQDISAVADADGLKSADKKSFKKSVEKFGRFKKKRYLCIEERKQLKTTIS